MALERTNTRDRRLYLWVAVLFPIIVLVGFARTYYLKGLFATPPLPSLLVHVHGIVMTAWVLLFVAQVGLVASRRTKVHRRLGVWGGILAGLVVLVGTLTAILSAARFFPDPAALEFLVIPFGDMLVFGILVGTALYFRRRLEVHKRLMLLGSLTLLGAAIARLPVTFIDIGRPLMFMGLTDLFVIACMLFDTIKNRRLHPAFVWGTLLFIGSQPLRLMLGDTELWHRFAFSLVGMVR